MKKYLILLVLLINLVPRITESGWQISCGAQVFAFAGENDGTIDGGCPLCYGDCAGDCVIVPPEDCPVCGSYPCFCSSILFCSFCGDTNCFGDCVNFCEHCGLTGCLGMCQDVCSSCGSSTCGGSCYDDGNTEEPDKNPIDKIWDPESKLTKEEKEKLKEILNLLCTKEMYEKLINHLSERKINFSINPEKLTQKDGSIVPAGYEKGTNKIYFRDEDGISSNALAEEMIHAVQFDFYGNSMTSSATNFEFEAKVFQDIACVSCGGDNACPSIGTMGMDEYSEYCNLYNSLIYSFGPGSKDFSESDIDTYNQLGEIWNRYPGQFDDSITPQLLLYFINN